MSQYPARLVASKAQGKKDRTAAAAERAARRRRLALIGFAVALVAMFVIVAVAQGLGDPSVDEGEVAVVEEAPTETITEEDVDRAGAQPAARQGRPEVPAEDDPQYELLREAALADLILASWVLGEAEEQGIEVSERAVDEEFERVREEIGSEQAFQRFLDRSRFTAEEARERVELQLISDRIQESVLPGSTATTQPQPEELAAELGITDEQVATFYDENPIQFEEPETRDVRAVLTETQEEADEALARLERDDSARSWEEVAKELSTDEATKRTGGLRPGLIEGQSDPVLDEQAFAAPEGELVGPFEAEAGFYVLEVERVSPPETTSLEDARPQILQTLNSARQQELAQSFQQDFADKWTSRTFCADGFLIDRCSNAEPFPDPCTEEVATTEGCDAPVSSTRPIAPGTAGVFGTSPPLGLPQGPITPQPEQAPGGLPPGLETLPGGVPPGAGAPPGTTPAPPGG